MLGSSRFRSTRQTLIADTSSLPAALRVESSLCRRGAATRPNWRLCPVSTRGSSDPEQSLQTLRAATSERFVRTACPWPWDALSRGWGGGCSVAGSKYERMSMALRLDGASAGADTSWKTIKDVSFTSCKVIRSGGI